MTRKDYILYVKTRREIVLTVKGVILYAYWRSRDMARSFAGLAVVVLGLQILYNAFQSDVKSLFAVSAFFIFAGLYIYRK